MAGMVKYHYGIALHGMVWYGVKLVWYDTSMVYSMVSVNSAAW
jgi:hypothetical protein